MCKRCRDNSDILIGKTSNRFPLRCECECKELVKGQFFGHEFCPKCGDHVKPKKERGGQT